MSSPPSYSGSPLIRELRESGRLTHTVLWSPPALLDGEWLSTLSCFSITEDTVMSPPVLGPSHTHTDTHTHTHTHTGLPRILRYALKALYQTMSLLWAVLIATKKPSHVLVQVG